MYQCLRCSKAAISGLYCPRHTATATISNKRKYKLHNKGFYSSRRWRSIRSQVLSQQPLCAACNLHGIVSPAIDVDHVYPLSHSPTLATTISNLQGLCHGCHSRKTQQEIKGYVYDYKRNRKIDLNTGSIAAIHMDTQKIKRH